MDEIETGLEDLRLQLIACLSGDLPGAEAQRHFAPELAYGRHAGPPALGARQAAVLVLAYLHAGEWFVPTMVRAHTMKEHAGQIALPGGSVDAGNFYVRPFLAICPARPDFQPSTAEVAELIEIPLRALVRPENQGTHQIQRRGVTFRAPHIQIRQHRVWGATCMILAEVVALMSRCAALGGA